MKCLATTFLLSTPLYTYRRYLKARVCIGKAIDEKNRQQFIQNAELLKKQCYEESLFLRTAIQEVQKGCRVRKITYIDVLNTCLDIEDHLKLTVSQMDESMFDVNLHATNYYYHEKRPESTVFGLIFRNGEWYMKYIKRFPNLTNRKIVAILQEHTKDALIKNILDF